MLISYDLHPPPPLSRRHPRRGRERALRSTLIPTLQASGASAEGALTVYGVATLLSFAGLFLGGILADWVRLGMLAVGGAALALVGAALAAHWPQVGGGALLAGVGVVMAVMYVAMHRHVEATGGSRAGGFALLAVAGFANTAALRVLGPSVHVVRAGLDLMLVAVCALLVLIALVGACTFAQIPRETTPSSSLGLRALLLLGLVLGLIGWGWATGFVFEFWTLTRALQASPRLVDLAPWAVPLLGALTFCVGWSLRDARGPAPRWRAALPVALAVAGGVGLLVMAASSPSDAPLGGLAPQVAYDVGLAGLTPLTFACATWLGGPRWAGLAVGVLGLSGLAVGPLNMVISGYVPTLDWRGQALALAASGALVTLAMILALSRANRLGVHRAR